MYQDSLDVVNNEPSPIEVTFEPWGRSRHIAACTSVRVDAASDLPGVLELVTTPGRAVVYAWSGSTMKVYDNGSLIADFNTPVPLLPDGKSSRLFFGPDGRHPARVALSTLQYRRWRLALFVSNCTLMPAFAALFRHWFDAPAPGLRISEILNRCGIAFLITVIMAAIVDRIAVQLEIRTARKKADQAHEPTDRGLSRW